MKKIRSIIAVILAACILLSTAGVLAETQGSGSSIEGTVLGNDGKSISVKMDNGNIFSFSMEGVQETDAKTGDRVIVQYEGDILSGAKAVAVTVTEASALAVASGKVIWHDAGSIYVQISETDVLGFKITDRTVITGLTQNVAAGDTVSVTYEGEVTEGPDAVQIDVTALKSTDRTDTAAETENTENKQLTGTVTSLSATKLSIKTSKNRVYTFRIVKKTKIKETKGALVVGCRVRITYDGYASKNPDAKKIEVIEAYNPKPTAKPVVLQTVSGTVESFGGMWLSLTNGYGFDVTYAKYSGNGKRVKGEKATVTFYTEGKIRYATKVEFTKK